MAGTGSHIGSSYKNWIGVTAVTLDSVLATKVTAAATSVKLVTATGITVSDTLVILDGTNTEFRAVSLVATNALTVTALTHAHGEGTYCFALPTTGFGPKAYVPMNTFKVPDKYAQVYDKSRVGSLAVERGVVQGMRQAEWTFDGDVFPDTFGWILASMFGTEVYTTGTKTQHTHAFSTDNSGNGQPVKHAWWVYDNTNLRVIVGRVTKLGLKFAAGENTSVMYSGTVMARASGVVATTPTPSFSSVLPLAMWRARLSIASTYTRIPLTFTVTLTREEAENIPTFNGTQDPLDTFVGALHCSVKGSYVKTGDTQLSKYIAGTVQKFVVTLAPLSTTGTAALGCGLTFQATKANYDTEEPILQGKAYNTEDFSFTAIANATDAGASGGISACKVSVKNAIATGVYLG